MRKRRVVVYARVSTEHDAQLSALENQKDWYMDYLESHKNDWELVNMYVDEGITGTSAQKRPQFMQMMKDAEDGDFDLILTREVSRFARNTVDTLQYTRQLKAVGVEVFFINDNIKTFDGDGELRLTIMATLAQDESRKTSVRVKAGQQTSMNNGVYYGNGNILGYDRIEYNGEVSYNQNPEQAKTVRMIFDWYLEGWGLRKIQFELERMGRKTAMGKSNWHCSNISKILQNSFYCGIITYHKEFTPDFLEQKKIRNFGDMEFTKVKGKHEPIITEEEYENAQKRIASRRRELTNNTSGKRQNPKGNREPIDVWTRLMRCSCGHQFNRKVWHRLDNEIQYGYQCYSSIRTGTVATRLKKGLPIDGICETPMIAGWKLQMMAKHIFREYLNDTQSVIDFAMSMLENHIDDEEPKEDNAALIEQYNTELNKLGKRLDNLVEMRADGEITKEIFKNKKTEIENRMAELNRLLDELDPQEEIEDEEDASYEEKISLLTYALDELTSGCTDGDIPDSVIDAFVEKIIVSKDGFEWYLRFDPDKDPKKLKVDGTRKNPEISYFGLPQHRLQSLTNKIRLVGNQHSTNKT